MVNLDLPILNRVKNILTRTEKIDADIGNVLTKLSEQGVEINSIISSIGTSEDQASAATLFGKLAGLASQSGGAVKSIQRGTYTNKVSLGDWDDIDKNININISTVNPAKCFCIFKERYYITCDNNDFSHVSDISQVKFVSIQATRFTVKAPYYREQSSTKF